MEDQPNKKSTRDLPILKNKKIKPEWSIIDTFFKDHPNFASMHHLNSYNKFFDNGIQ